MGELPPVPTRAGVVDLVNDLEPGPAQCLLAGTAISGRVDVDSANDKASQPAHEMPQHGPRVPNGDGLQRPE